MKVMYYFSTYRDDETTHQNLSNMVDSCRSKNVNIITIFRYEYKFLQSPRFENIGKEFISNIKSISSKSSKELDTVLDFNKIRKMSSKSRLTDDLPDDNLLIAFQKAWEMLFRKHKPDYFLCGLMDDFVGNTGLEVARALNIKIITMYAGGGIENALKIGDGNYHEIFYKDLSDEELSEAYEKAHDEWKGTIVRDQSIIKKYSWMHSPLSMPRLVKAFFSSLRYYYFNIPKSERILWSSPFLIAKRQIRYFISKQISKLYYETPKNEKYILLPLNFMDDALMFSMLPDFDLIKFVKKLRETTPKDIMIYIKPHPHWQNADLSIKEIRTLSRMKGVKLLSPNENTRELINGSQYTVIINSSVMFDCVFLGKIVRLFGNIVPSGMNPSEWKRYIANMYLHSFRQNSMDLYTKGGVDRRDSDHIVETILEIDKYYQKRLQNEHI